MGKTNCQCLMLYGAKMHTSLQRSPGLVYKGCQPRNTWESGPATKWRQVNNQGCKTGCPRVVQRAMQSHPYGDNIPTTGWTSAHIWHVVIELLMGDSSSSFITNVSPVICVNTRQRKADENRGKGASKNNFSKKRQCTLKFTLKHRLIFFPTTRDRKLNFL